MKIDDIKAYLVANLGPFISDLSTGPVPLVAIPTERIFVSEYHEATGSVSLSLVEGDETIEEISLNTRQVTLPVVALVQVLGNTKATQAAQAVAYAQAIVNCLRIYPDFNTITGRDNFVGVEGKDDIKATQINLEFVYTEAI
jgi:hypothetical protein